MTRNYLYFGCFVEKAIAMTMIVPKMWAAIELLAIEVAAYSLREWFNRLW